MSELPLLVTGATGFLGRHVVSQLLAGGRRVRVLQRSDRDVASLGEVEVALGDVCDAESVARAVSGASAVLHCAGKVSRDPADAEILREVHVVGTRNVVAKAKAAGVRVVLASTSGTVAISEKPETMTEKSPTPLALVAKFPYYRSKLYAEEEALRAARDGADVVSVNPTLLLGPGDVRGSSTEDVWKFLTKSIPVTPSGGVSFVDARDAATAMIAALERGKTGERYLVTAANLTVRDFFDRLSRLSGVPAPPLVLPKTRWLSKALYDGTSKLAKAVGGELAVDAASFEMGGLYWWVDASKAERELGFSARDVGETLAETVRELQGG